MLKKIFLIVLSAAVLCVPCALAGELEFTQAPVPQTDLEKRVPLSSQYASVDGQIVPFGFHTILRSGDEVSPEQYKDHHRYKGHHRRWHQKDVFGQLIDIEGHKLIAEDGSEYISNDNDFSSLIKGDDHKLYMVSHFESRPGAMYITAMEQTEAGELKALKTRPLDFSFAMGGWVHCAGSVTPWGTHLGSEEYEPDAKQWLDGNISEYNAAMAKYFGEGADPAVDMNPYDYGYPVEVDVHNFRRVDVDKHYAMGRIALELAYVMPDKKTVYMSDDGTNVGLFRFIADKPYDLSAGTLYVAKWIQQDGQGPGSADIQWIDLGHATERAVEKYLRKGTTFNQIFGSVPPENGTCPDGYTSINAGHEDGNQQCLQVLPGMELAASRLETRRYAAMMGGTTEFRKMEGITHNPDTNQLYIAMSEVGRGMEDHKKFDAPNDAYDIGGPNDIRLDHFNTCGTVYALDLAQTAQSDYSAVKMHSLIDGVPTHTDYGADTNDNFDGTNHCDVNGIANPDNITYIPGYHTLIIGEDSGDGHQNDMIWSLNIETGALTRIQTTPYGSETTSPYFYPNINGHAYIMSVIQHPYGESDSDKLVDPSDKHAYTGYLGPLPPMDGSAE